jgi:hypothetical protein
MEHANTRVASGAVHTVIDGQSDVQRGSDSTLAGMTPELNLRIITAAGIQPAGI